MLWAGNGYAEPSPLMQRVQQRLGNHLAQTAPATTPRQQRRADIVRRFESIACTPYVSPTEVQGFLRELPGRAVAQDQYRRTELDGSTTTFTVKRTGSYPDGSPRGYIRSEFSNGRNPFKRTLQCSTSSAWVRVATKRSPDAMRYIPLVHAVLGRKRTKTSAPSPADPVDVGAVTSFEYAGQARRVRYVQRDVDGYVTSNTITRAKNGDHERYQYRSAPGYGQRELRTLQRKGTKARSWLRKEHDLRSGTISILGQASGRAPFKKTLTPAQTSKLLARMSRRAGVGERVMGMESTSGWRNVFQNLSDGIPGFSGNVVVTGKNEKLKGLSSSLFSSLGTRHGTLRLGRLDLLAGTRKGALTRVSHDKDALEKAHDARAEQTRARARREPKIEITTEHQNKVARALDRVIGKRPEGYGPYTFIEEGAASDAAVQFHPTMGTRLVFSPRAAATFSLDGLSCVIAHEVDHMNNQKDYHAPRLKKPSYTMFYGGTLGRNTQQRLGQVLFTNELRRLELRADRSAARFAKKKEIPLETCVKHLPPDPPGVPRALDDHPRLERRRSAMTQAYNEAAPRP
jgi:hypothetical protein